MDFNRENGVPEGRIIPVYLGDDGNVYPIFVHSMDELEMVQVMVSSILGGKVVVDTKHPINNEKDKISIIDFTKNKK